MNIAVCVKHAVDEGELRGDSTGKPQMQGALAKMSTFDRNAIEEALRVKESRGGTVTVVGLGGQDWKKSLKEALAMGCDRAVAVSASRELDTLSTAYFLSRAIQRAGLFDLVFLAEGASDTYHGLVGPMLASWLDVPFVGYARKVSVEGETLKAEVALDERAEAWESPLPAVVSVVSEINTPRYPTLLQIMQASKKPMEDVTLEALTDERAPHSVASVADMSLIPTNRKKVVFEGPADETAQKLAEALRKEGLA